MDLFSIVRVLWRHKRVAIPVVLITIIGMFYVVLIKSPAYQANANVLLINPPAPPTAAEIAQEPGLAKVNNPYANLGNPTYVADVITTLITSTASQQLLENAGASPGYEVSQDSSNQILGEAPPPALDITGVGSSAQAAVQSANLVAGAIIRDLRQLQNGAHVKSTFMITAVEYVRPTSAVKSSSGQLKTALGIVVIGFIILLVAVSAAQGLEERRSGGPYLGRESDSRGGGRHEPAGPLVDAQYREAQWAEARLGDSHAAGPVRGSGLQRAGGNGTRDETV